MIKILSLDGGGIRGLIPALVLAEVEKRTGRRIAEQFDLIAGTSTGGIIALGLVIPDNRGKPKFRAEEIADLYRKEGKTIFSGSLWKKTSSGGGLLDERYAEAGIERVLDNYFGEAKLTEALTDVLIPTYEIETRKAWFFKSHNAKNPAEREVYRDVLLKDVARATSAAPTYFEPKFLQLMGNNFAFIDGGVYANNPAMCAYVEAKTLYPEEQDFLVVSLGTGGNTRPIWFKDAKDWGMAKWAQPVLNVVFDGIDDTIDYQLQQLLPLQEGDERYYRIQTQLRHASDDLDDVTDQNIYALQTTAWTIIEENDRKLDALCRQLVRV